MNKAQRAVVVKTLYTAFGVGLVWLLLIVADEVRGSMWSVIWTLGAFAGAKYVAAGAKADP